MTLYHHFASKDEVVLAALAARRKPRQRGLSAAMDRATSPRAKILAAFDHLGELVREPGFRGCAFINAAVELADREHPAVELVREHKAWLRACFAAVAERAGWRRPAVFGLQCLLLWDGAVLEEALSPGSGAVQAARAAVPALIAASA